MMMMSLIIHEIKKLCKQIFHRVGKNEKNPDKNDYAVIFIALRRY